MPAPPSARRTVLGTGLAVLLGLLATVDDRYFGAIPDGQQMTSAAVALARSGEMGVSSFFGYVGHGPRGTYSRYGMGQSFAEVPAALAARALAGAAPGAASGPLFVLVPVCALATAAAATAAAALSVGASPLLAAATGAALVFATPLWGYAGSDLSEPLQAALLALGLATALRVRRPGLPLTAAGLAGAGFAIGLAPLAKSTLWAAALPLLLLAGPLLRHEVPPARKKGRRQEKAQVRWPLLGGFGTAAALWALLDLWRFGKLLGGYDGEGFAYPPLAGLLRLTVLPNKGLLFYAPLVLLAPLGLLALWRRDRPVALALAVPVAALYATAVGWWAWDGQAGWGPRLVLPVLPFLAVAGAAALATAGESVRRRPLVLAASLLALAGVAVNALGALQPFPGLYALASTVPPAPIEPGRAAGTPYEIEPAPDGTLLATGPHHLSLTPAWSPQRLTLRLLAARLAGGDVAARLATAPALDPPFAVEVPDDPPVVLRAALSPFRWPFWGRSWLQPGAGLDPWAGALLDQAIRSSERRDDERTLALSRESLAWPGPRREPRLLALGAEAAARRGDAAEARRLVEAAGPCTPWALFVTTVVLAEDPPSCPGVVDPARLGSLRASAAGARAQGVTLAAWAKRAAAR